MPKNKAQVIFECSETFRDRLQQEKTKRRTSVKRMIMAALEDYWRRPLRTQLRMLTLEWEPPPVTSEKRHWAEMFMQYLERCPAAKVQLLQSVIVEDLKVYAARKKRTKEPPGRVKTVRMKRLPKDFKF